MNLTHELLGVLAHSLQHVLGLTQLETAAEWRGQRDREGRGST